MVRTSYISMRWWWWWCCSIFTGPTCLVGSLKQVRGQTYHSTRTHYLDSEPTSLCSYSLMFNAQRRSSKNQFYSLWFDLTKMWTHDLPLSRGACRGATIHFFHKRYVSQYLICITIRITIRFIGNCNYSLKSMLVDMFFFIWGRLRTSGNYKYLIFD